MNRSQFCKGGVLAGRSGKDVCIEKRISYRIREGRLMAEAARRKGRIVQVELKQRSGAHVQREKQIVQSGQPARSFRCGAGTMTYRRRLRADPANAWQGV